MSANMYGRRFAERNGYAWWGSGIRLEGEDNKATTAVIKSGNNFPVSTRTLFYKDDDGSWIESDNVAITRPFTDEDKERHPVQLGVASAAYTPITNYRVAELLDPLTDKWPVETVGSLGRGEDFFLTLNAGRASIAGDEMQQFMFIWNKHDGSGALRIMFTPVRVVCQNTCLLGARKANVTASVMHSRRVDEETAFAIDLTARLQKAQTESMSELAMLPNIRLTAEQIKQVLAATYPIRPRTGREEQARELLAQVESGAMTLSLEEVGKLANVRLTEEKLRERAAKLRLLSFQRMMAFNDENPSFANTAWALYAGITEVETHGKPGAALTRSVMMGERGRNVAAAYDALVALAR